MESILNTKINKKVLITAGYIISALMLPQMFHLFGIPGNVFLPMHIPVLLAGFTLGPIYGMLSGVASPVISCLLTGMPVVFPVMPIMVFELGTYGLISGLISKKEKIPFILKLIITLITGRIAYGLIYHIIKQFFFTGIASGISVINATKAGIPGILIQLVVITIAMKLLEKKEKQ